MAYRRVSPGMYQQGRNGPIVKSLRSPDLRGVGIGSFERNQFNGAPQKLPPNSQVGIGGFEQNQFNGAPQNLPGNSQVGIGGFEQNQMPGQTGGPSYWGGGNMDKVGGGNSIHDLVGHFNGRMPQMPNEQGYGPGQPPQMPNESGYSPQPFTPPLPPMPDGTSTMNPMQQQMYGSLPWQQAQQSQLGVRPQMGQGLASALMGVSQR